MTYSHIDDLLNGIQDRICRSGKPVTVAVAGAHEGHVFSAVERAWRDGIITPIVTGKEETIRALMTSHSIKGDEMVVIPAETDEEAAALAVEQVKQGNAEVLMKGLMNTSTLFRAVLDKETGLPREGLISHFVLAEIEGYHKLVAYTDVGINISPDLEQKKGILRNAVSAMQRYGVEKPKVAVLAAVETINPKMPETVDGNDLKEMAKNGEFGDCYVEGPISFDLALDKEAAAVKQFDSPVAGDADILLVPSVVTGNIMAKALKTFAGLKSVAIALGAAVPIVVTSRATSADSKYRSIIAAAGIVRGA